MRYHKKMGLAGLPGVSLDAGDFRQLSSYFRSGTGLSGLGACRSCSSTGDHSRDVAGAVADTLGLGELADAARDGSIPAPMGQANLLASATMQAMKFKGEKVATLNELTNPAFCRTVQKLAGKLKSKMPEDKAYLSALTLCYTNGAIDSAAGRGTPMSHGFASARGKLAAALRGKNHPQALAMLAGLGYSKQAALQAREQAAAAAYDNADNTASWSGGAAANAADRQYGRQAAFQSDYIEAKPMVSAWKAEKPQEKAAVFLNSREYYFPPKRQVDMKDLGRDTVPPDQIELVPVYNTLLRLSSLLYGRDKEPNVRANADKDPMNRNAAVLAAWIFRTLKEPEKKQLSETIANGLDLGDGGVRIAAWYLALRYNFEASKVDGKVPSPAERRVGDLMWLAARYALARTGQIGQYVDGTWKPDFGGNGDQQGPQSLSEDATKYIVEIYTKLEAKPSKHRMIFAHDAYQAAYQKIPTVSAMNWYGSFLYNLSDSGYGWLGGQSGSGQAARYRKRIGELESVRMSGSSPPPEDLVDNSNVFMQMFSALGTGLGWVLDQINKGVQFAINALCGIFKTLMGPEVGGVLCAIFTAIIKIVAGGIKASIAAIMSLGKAIAGAIGFAIQGKWVEAATAFFVGVNTAVVFLMGGVFADLIGIPFLKAEEQPEGLPSLERMGEELTKDDPLFLVNLVLAVIGVIVGRGSPMSIGALFTALAPVLGMILAPSIKKALAATNDGPLLKYKDLPIPAIKNAVVSIVRLISAVIVGVLTARGFISVITEELKKFAEREGGTGAAVVKSLQFFLENLGSQLTGIIAAIAAQPFQMQVLIDRLMDLLKGFLLLIPMFATNMGFSEKGQSAAVGVSLITANVSRELESTVKYMKTSADYAMSLASPANSVTPPATGVQTQATVCTPTPGGKVVETKTITNTIVKTKPSIPALALVGAAALVLGIGLGRAK